jgi:hypothetical protein
MHASSAIKVVAGVVIGRERIYQRALLLASPLVSLLTSLFFPWKKRGERKSSRKTKENERLQEHGNSCIYIMS